MEKVCIKCGEITLSEGAVALCSHCGAELNAPLEEIVDDTPTAVMPEGTKVQPMVVVSYIISLVNLILGTISVFVAIFYPMLPPKLFQVVPYIAFFGCALLLPIVAVICLVLNTIAKRKYNPAIHTPKNLMTAKLSYGLSVCAVLFWIAVIVVGLGITFYNIKLTH